MKNSIWDILTGIILLGILCLIAGFGVVVMNPGLLGLNRNAPVGPGELVPTIALPTNTEVPLELPPTYTATAAPATSVPATAVPDTSGGGGVLPTLRPSSTPLPTNTRVVLPTFTATKKATLKPGTLGGGGSGSGGSCTIVYQNPADGTVMDKGEDFSTRWTIKNNTQNTWASDSVDIRVIGGERMHFGASLRDLPYSVGSGGMIDIIIDMEAPDGKGTYTENWGLFQGSKSVCQFFVTIEVK